MALRWSSGASMENRGAGQPLCPPATLLGQHRHGRWWGCSGVFFTPFHEHPELSTASQLVPTGRVDLVLILWHIPGDRVRNDTLRVGQRLLSLLSPCGHGEWVLPCQVRQLLYTSRMGSLGSFLSNKGCIPDCPQS